MELIAAIFLFAFTLAITPGPNNIMLMSAGANFGIRRNLPMVAGICVGFPLLVVGVGLGLGSVFKLYPIVLVVMNIVGIAYLLYLAWRIAFSPIQQIDQRQKGRQAKPFGFIQMALFQWVNPKAWVMATGAIATYVTTDSDPYLQVLKIALIFLSVSLPCACLWLIFGASLKSFMESARKQRVFNRVMAGILVLSLVPVILDLFK